MSLYTTKTAFSITPYVRTYVDQHKKNVHMYYICDHSGTN